MSSSDQYWALPDGISEALPDEAWRLETLRRELLDIYATWGYQLVMPPLVEYIKSLNTGVGSNLDIQTFKVTDQQTGRMMGIRADMTPQIARIDAHKLQTDQPNRLCYIGSVLRTRPQNEGGTRAPLQVGAELFGHEGLDSDFEVMSLLLATLEHCKVGSLTLDLGHVGIFRELAKQAEFSSEQEQIFSDMLSRKALPEINEWLSASDIPAPVREMLAQLPLLYGPVSMLEQAKTTLKNATQPVHESLDYLSRLSQRLQSIFPECKLHIDLTELSGYSYHTGIVYAVYASETGKEIARGGRYDGAGKLFGRSRPATGFSTNLRLLSSSAEIPPRISNKILAPADDDVQLEKLITQLRKQGECVIRQLSGCDMSSQQVNANRQIIQKNDQWIVEEV
ncbi:MAG: ATP phosphoribosyltransferase regulatory subunit (EC [uncultured Thiotrichaceae bacterium]|uniref:ATP phosphoribosyltransferase regulatory subunit n=1 Tax=uncultured Thiotrichaceae bacterium TaxID=298394 RepID=A0A6S6TZL9_9GAMM|nr:MAG: ATP phosphoribosyltransferase regulatory subunit (EC [uncultured Thiotrichaceae bacterium]